jgi:hypothetical protein
MSLSFLQHFQHTVLRVVLRPSSLSSKVFTVDMAHSSHPDSSTGEQGLNILILRPSHASKYRAAPSGWGSQHPFKTISLLATC